MITPTNEGLLAPSDIADLANVSRAAVSNWRKRMPDFPQPSGGTANKPLFTSSDVMTWLAAHPEKNKAATGVGAESKAWERGLWGAANLLRGNTSMETMGEVFVQTAVDVIEGAPSHDWPDMKKSTLDEVRAVIAGIPRDKLADAIDGVLERTSRAQGKSAGNAGFVGSRTSTLLASLAADLEGGVLYDPACGIGVALLQALEMGARPDQVVGDEINAMAARLAALRAKLHGVNLKVNNLDVLLKDADPSLRANVIIAEPPFGVRINSDASMLDPRLRFGFPPRSSGDSFWLQHVVAHLAPGGVGYVVGARGALSRRGPETDIRKNLLHGGHVRAVVGLPGKMLPHTSIPLALWVLGDPETMPAADVLLIDATNVDEPETLVADWLTHEDSLASVPHRRVAVSELTAADADLNPAKWVTVEGVDATEVMSTYKRARTELTRATTALPDAATRISAPAVLSRPLIMTVAKLIEAGAVELVAARPARTVDMLQFAGRQVDAAAVRKRKISDTSELPPTDDPRFLTEPGDVLITAMHDIQAVVDEDGGHIPVGSVSRLRVRDRTKLDPHYLADALSGDWNLRFDTGTVISRIPVRDLEVPLLTFDEQRAVHAAIAQAQHAKALAQQASAAADSVASTMLTAMRHGITLTSTTTERAEE
ncbi:N-6 DNA methylase [Rathayibacter sp. AY1F9]|uniref:N-6 DNA methylase n=1 Tax=Rathayibacter sp. AY1F9 TaxID=2080563 RepID=UPI000CE7B4FC|nr:N-6 DNA methylase [Rathayibacter sp. AY1F9]PPH30323.1 type I restriction endonuclease [Rathayibacter sp. AY1F9]